MGNKTHSRSTQQAEPHHPAVSKAPSFQQALADISWRIALAVLGLSGVGILLDRQFKDQEPLFSLLGIGTGLLVASITVYRFVQRHFPGTFGGDN